MPITPSSFSSPIDTANAKNKVRWIWERMPLLQGIEKEFAQSTPFAGLRIGICLHIEPKTANLVRVLRAGGAEISITGSPGTTQDDVAMLLIQQGNDVYGWQSDTRKEHVDNISAVVDFTPDMFLDNGADLYSGYIAKKKPFLLKGGTEETTSGANILRNKLSDDIDFPVIVINDSPLKRIVENQHGVGQTIIEGFMRATNTIIPAKKFVVIGYGWCGKGVANYLKQFGAQVIVVDTSPIAALEAAMDGFVVSTLSETLGWGDVFITVTGYPDIISISDIKEMKTGVILANAGHFSTEIEIEALKSNAIEVRIVNESITEYILEGEKVITLLTRGEMLNLAGGNGNPVETMDLGLALQALSLKRVVGTSDLSNGPQPVPDDINSQIATAMLESFGYSV